MPERRLFAKTLLPLLALLVGFAWLAIPQPAEAGDPKVEWSASLSPDPAREGEHLVLTLEAEIPEHFHLYSLTRVANGPRPLDISLDHEAIEFVGDWHAPEPTKEVDPNFKKEVEFYADHVTHERAVLLGSLEAGKHDLELLVRGQICDDHSCLSFNEKVAVALEVEAADARAEYAGPAKFEGRAFSAEGGAADEAAGDGSAKGRAREGEGLPASLFSFLAVALLAGFGALATPCVFPMIPITVGFFSKFTEVSMRRTVAMASIYAISIVGTFTIAGVGVSLVFGAMGMQVLSSSIWFNGFIAILLIAFAFNLFGLFEIRVPSFLVNRTAQKENELKNDDGNLGRQMLGVFFMGLTFTLISFTCTVGFIGLVLAEAAKGNWFYPAIGMLTFSLAFSLPFFILAIFPSWAEKLQGKAGDWMVSVKVSLGFLELAGAFKFVSNVDLIMGWGMITRDLVLALWIGIFLVAGLYLLRLFQLAPGSGGQQQPVGSVRMVIAMTCFSLAGYSLTGIGHTRSMGGWLDGWLPPAVYPGQQATVTGTAAGGHGELTWIIDDLDKGMEEGRAENMPVFIDFTGYTCTNCRYMEASVFPIPGVHERLGKMKRVTAYTDCLEDVCTEQRQYQVDRFETAALPFYAIIDPHTDEILATFASSTNDPAEFEAFLQDGLDAFGAGKPQAAAPAEPKPAVDMKEALQDPFKEAPAEESDEFADVSVDLDLEGPEVDFSFPKLDGEGEMKLSELKGEWVFVNFWASWCAPCKKELEKDFPGALERAGNIKLVTVAFDGEDTKEVALEFAKEIDLLKHVTLMGGEDKDEAGLPEAFGEDAMLPQSFLINPEGKMVWKRVGSVDGKLLDRLFEQTKG